MTEKETAIEEAIRLKRDFERALETQLNDFTATTGLAIEGLDITAIETSTIGIMWPEFNHYKIQARITLIP